MTDQPQKIFDGHNDILLKLLDECKADPVKGFFTPRDGQHIDLQSAQQGGFAGGLFAMFIPPEDGKTYEKAPSQTYAIGETNKMIRLLRDIQEASDGQVKICKSVDEIEDAFASNQMAPVLHIEGAEAVMPDLSNLENLYKEGLRSLGPVWSRENDFAYGVPFKFPASPDTGPGLKEAGVELVKACNELGIAIDLSHINEKGFWDVAKHSDKPLIASHSNAHALCQSTRNLLDTQLDAIKESGGIAGLNFGTIFLNPKGVADSGVPLSTMVDQVRYMVDKMGIDHVGLGSDYDGTGVPTEVDSTAKLPNLVNALSASGFSQEEMDKITHKNWFRVLRETWGE